MSDSPYNDYARSPMLWLAAAFAGGIAMGYTGAFTFSVAGITIVFLTTACMVFRSGVVRFCVPLIFIPLGAICFNLDVGRISESRVKRIYEQGRIESYAPVEIEGVLVGYPEPQPDGSVITIRVERLHFKETVIDAAGTVRLFAANYEASRAELDLRHGSIVRVACRLEREERFLNPGVKSRPAMLAEQGIDAVASLKSPAQIEKLGEDSVFLPILWSYKLRLKLIEAFRSNFSPRTSGVLIASLLGGKHFLDRETAEVFREGGTFHVLVISGLHITFIGGLTLWILSFVTRRIGLQSAIAAGLLWAYTFAVGAEIPVVRASLMFTLLLLARLLYRDGSALNSLGACTLLLLVYRPADLFTPSFQLTFISVAAIVGCAFPLIAKMRAIGNWAPSRDTPLPPNVGRPLRTFCELLYWSERGWEIRNRREIWSAGLFKSQAAALLRAPNLQSVWAYIFEGLLVSLIVQLWMLPFAVIYFHRVSPVGIFLNLWVGVLLAFESFAAVGALMIMPAGDWLAAPLTALTEILNDAMIAVPSAVSSLGIADTRSAVYSGGSRVIYVLYAIAIVGLSARIFAWDPFATSSRLRGFRTEWPTAAAIVIFGFLIIWHPLSSPAPNGRLRIDFLDVGQGDAALVTFPNGQTMLVDGGGRVDFRDDEVEFEPDVPRIGEVVVSEFLWEKGYSRIDYVVATHADADHAQGLVDVVRNFEVGALFVGDPNREASKFVELLSVSAIESVPVYVIRRGDSFELGGVKVGVLHPADSTRQSDNDQSIVLELKFGLRTMLLTGDIEQAAETELVDSDIALEADVVKVPHHGSRTSSTNGFVESVRAGVAVIPVGRRSRFGHPHPEVVDRWLQGGSRVITTGERGTVTIESDGTFLATSTFKP